MSVGKALKTAKWLWLSPSVYYFNASTVNASLAASLGNTASKRGQPSEGDGVEGVGKRDKQRCQADMPLTSRQLNWKCCTVG